MYIGTAEIRIRIANADVKLLASLFILLLDVKDWPLQPLVNINSLRIKY
jgi:hypothetical protein